jgi:hypothetical protein
MLMFIKFVEPKDHSTLVYVDDDTNFVMIQVKVCTKGAFSSYIFIISNIFALTLSCSACDPLPSKHNLVNCIYFFFFPFTKKRLHRSNTFKY